MNPADELKLAKRIYEATLSRPGLNDKSRACAALYLAQAHARVWAHETHETRLSEAAARACADADIWEVLREVEEVSGSP